MTDALAEFSAGLFFDEPEAVYHRHVLGELSASALKQVLRSPMHYHAWTQRKLDDGETPALIFGKALHCALLEPDRFEKVYGVLPADAPRRPSITQRNAANPSDDTLIAIQWWDRWTRLGKVTLSAEDFERLRRMQASAFAHPWARRLLRNGRSEVTARWIDEETGLAAKCRFDYLVDDEGYRHAVELKSCADASFNAFGRAVHNYDYHVGAAHYCDGARILKKPLKSFTFLAIESEEPYVCQPYVLDAEAEACGETLRARGARVIKRCLDSGAFPGYSDEIENLSLPPWALKDTRGEETE